MYINHTCIHTQPLHFVIVMTGKGQESALLAGNRKQLGSDLPYTQHRQFPCPHHLPLFPPPSLPLVLQMSQSLSLFFPLPQLSSGSNAAASLYRLRDDRNGGVYGASGGVLFQTRRHNNINQVNS